MNASFLLTWLAGTLLPLGALWLLYRLALRGERCFGYNRALLLLAPVVAVALPLLPHPALPGWLSNSAAAGEASVSVLLPAVQVGHATGSEGVGWSGWAWLGLLYLAGIVLGLGRLGWQATRLCSLARRLPREVRPGYVLAYTGGLLPTSSFGHVIFWDETLALAPTEAAAVLAHELAHVRQHHTLDRLWLEAWRVVLWPNPFVHLLLPALRLTHELLADREATATASPEAMPYPTLLARLAARRLGGPVYASLLQPFTFSFTLTRIAMLQNQIPVRRWKQWLVLPVLGGLFFAACKTTSEQVIPLDKEARIAQLKAKVLEAFRQDSLYNGGKGWRDSSRMLKIDKEGNVSVEKVSSSLTMPELPGGGGVTAIVEAIQNNLIYPTDNTKQPLPGGRAFITFTVAADGSMQGLKIMKSLGPAYDAALTAAIIKLPRLTPAHQNGQPVSQSLTIPIMFKPKS